VSAEDTVLFVGAGRHQRRALQRVKELGVGVVAVDRNPDAPGLEIADVGEVVDFADVEAADMDQLAHAGIGGDRDEEFAIARPGGGTARASSRRRR